MSTEAGKKEMKRLRDEATEAGVCNYGWWRWEGRRNFRRGHITTPEVCGKSPVTPTDAPLAIKYEITQVCEGCLKRVILQEQIASAMESDPESIAWLQKNGHTAPTYTDMFGEDDE